MLDAEGQSSHGFVISTQKLCLSFQFNFYQQLQGAAMGSPVFLVIANIYMEYFEVLGLGSECPIPTSWWKRYVDDIISIV